MTTLTPAYTQIASGLRFPEGPVAMPDGSVVLVEIERRTLSRVTPDGKIHVIAHLGGGPNGIGLSPDEGTLYVVETPTARCWSFRLSAPGQIESANGPYRGEKGTVVVGLGGYQMFDSLAVDGEGHVCVATLITGAVSDIWPDGSRVDQYMLPDLMVTNVCFGGRELRTAYATLSMGGTLVSFAWPRAGLPLAFSARADRDGAGT